MSIDQEAMRNSAAYQNRSNYADNLAHRSHNVYGGGDAYGSKNDPYANKNDPYAKKNDPYAKERADEEKKGPWSLDYEILRFFRENFNAGVDFEDTPRAFFDEEHIMSLRLRMLTRNFKSLLLKFIFMTIFSVVTIIMPLKGVLIFGFIYLVVFYYYLAVPIAFSKYCRQYIIDDSENGKTKKIYNIYSKWLKPLETFGIVATTVFFISIEILVFFNIDYVKDILYSLAEKTHIDKIAEYIHDLSFSDMQNSVLLVIAFYIFALVSHKVFVYKIWAPKWERKRKENEKAYLRSNQRTATSLKSELVSEEV